MLTTGAWAMLMGVSALFTDAIYDAPAQYVYGLDGSVWAWVHLTLGVLTAAAGIWVMRGGTGPRAVAVTVVVLGAVVVFLFVPDYPVWSVLGILLDLIVIWALTAGQRARRAQSSAQRGTDMVLAATGWGLPAVLQPSSWTMLVFFSFIIWIWLLFAVFADVFHRDDIGGWGKAGWIALMIVLPFIGVLAYLITQSRGMAERREAAVAAARADFETDVRAVVADVRPPAPAGRGDRLGEAAARGGRHHAGGVRHPQAPDAGAGPGRSGRTRCGEPGQRTITLTSLTIRDIASGWLRGQ